MPTCPGTNQRTASPTSNLVISFCSYSFAILCMFLQFVFSKLCLDNNNRVKLLSEPGSAGSDYINASFVSVSICCQRKRSLIISNHRYSPHPPCISRATFAPMSSLPPRVLCQALWLTFGGWSGKQAPAPSPCWLSVMKKAEWVFVNAPRPPSSAHERTSWATFAGSVQLWYQPRLLQRSEARVFMTFQIRCHKYWPEDNKPMSVFSDILVSKVSEEVSHDWTVRTLKVEKVKIPTHVTNVPIMWVIGYLYQLPVYWPITFTKMAFLRDWFPFFTSCCAFPLLYWHNYS